MLATSGDILNLIISISVAVFTTFVCIAIFYFISSIQKVHKVIKRIEGGITKAEEVISLVRDKIKNGAAYMMILGEVLKKAMDFVESKKNKSSEPKTSKTKKK